MIKLVGQLARRLGKSGLTVSNVVGACPPEHRTHIRVRSRVSAKQPKRRARVVLHCSADDGRRRSPPFPSDVERRRDSAEPRGIVSRSHRGERESRRSRGALDGATRARCTAPHLAATSPVPPPPSREHRRVRCARTGCLLSVIYCARGFQWSAAPRRRYQLSRRIFTAARC